MLTKEHFADLLMDSADVRKGENNSYFTAMSADKDCPYDIIANFFYEKERIIFLAHAPQMKLKPYDVAKAIFFCNRVNREYLNQVVYFYSETNELRMSGCLFTDCELSDAYIVRNFINFYLQAAKVFFTEASVKFHGKPGSTGKTDI